MPDTPVYGLEADALPDAWTPLEAFVVLKCLDDEGGVALVMRATKGLRLWDSVGMLTAALDVQREGMRADFVDDEGEDDD